MTTPITHTPDVALDLVFERTIDIPPDAVFEAWTTPDQLKQWFTPRPWKTVDAQLDLRPGGIFRTTMRSPEGQEFDNAGCYLEVVKNRKLVWTNALMPGFRPVPGPNVVGADCDSFAFTAILTFEPHGAGTRYKALVAHKDEAGRKKHEAMGFQEGWGKALDQLVDMVKATKGA